MEHAIDEVRDYWNSHLNCTQFITDRNLTIGSDEFYKILENHISNHHSYKVKLLGDFATACRGKKLLEVGCGLGVELGRLGKLGMDVTGIDLSPNAVEIAGNYLERLGVSGKTVVQNVEHMDFADECFDAIYSSGVIQHTPDIKKAISEMTRVLRPGGKLLVILYHRHSWFYLLHKLTGINIEFNDKDAPIINTYTRSELKSLFGSLRNVNINCEYYYPRRTRRRGSLAFFFNYMFVPSMRIIPAFIMKNFGWHLVLRGIK